MGSGFSKIFSEDAPGETGNEYQPLPGEPTPPDENPGDGGPPPEIASEYQPLGGDPVDPENPVA